MSREDTILSWLRDQNAIEAFHGFAMDNSPVATVLRPALVGEMWERLFCQTAIELGHKVEDIAADQLHFDFVVNGSVRVQCKSCNRRDGVVDIRARYPTEATGRTYRYPHDAFDVLALQTAGRAFLVPAKRLCDPGRPAFMRTRLQRKQYEPFRDRWDILTAKSA